MTHTSAPLRAVIASLKRVTELLVADLVRSGPSARTHTSRLLARVSDDTFEILLKEIDRMKLEREEIVSVQPSPSRRLRVAALVLFCRLPIVQQQLVDLAGGVSRYALQHVLEVGPGVDAVALAGADQRVQNRGAAAAFVTAHE